MQRNDNPAVQAAYDAWTDSTLLKAEHLLDCQSGCGELVTRCPAGMLLAEEERALWRAYYGLRIAAGVEVLTS